jgi:small subunit ribosomal protein S20
MPNHKSAWKQLRQNEKRRMQNKKHKSFLRKTVKDFRAVEDPARSKEELPSVVSAIDKSAKKGIIHHRKAARLKSRLARKTA